MFNDMDFDLVGKGLKLFMPFVGQGYSFILVILDDFRPDFLFVGAINHEGHHEVSHRYFRFFYFAQTTPIRSSVANWL